MNTINRLLKKHCLGGWLMGLVLMLSIVVLTTAPCEADWNPSGGVNITDETVDKFAFVNKTASIYTNNNWKQRKIPLLGQGVNFAPADFNNHYKVLKGGFYAITLTLDHHEGGGMTNRVGIQFYNKAAGWGNMHAKTATPNAAGVRLLTVTTTAYLARNDYIRFMFKTANNGNNNYAGRRNYRVAIIQLSLEL